MRSKVLWVHWISSKYSRSEERELDSWAVAWSSKVDFARLIGLTSISTCIDPRHTSWLQTPEKTISKPTTLATKTSKTLTRFNTRLLHQLSLSQASKLWRRHKHDETCPKCLRWFQVFHNTKGKARQEGAYVLYQDD